MKTLLSLDITESQKGEFPDSGPIGWGHFRLSQISLISLSSAVNAITRRKLASFSGALLAVSCDYQ
jgi:hypothetical protein